MIKFNRMQSLFFNAVFMDVAASPLSDCNLVPRVLSYPPYGA